MESSRRYVFDSARNLTKCWEEVNPRATSYTGNLMDGESIDMGELLYNADGVYLLQFTFRYVSQNNYSGVMSLNVGGTVCMVHRFESSEDWSTNCLAVIPAVTFGSSASDLNIYLTVDYDDSDTDSARGTVTLTPTKLVRVC